MMVMIILMMMMVMMTWLHFLCVAASQAQLDTCPYSLAHMHSHQTATPRMMSVAIRVQSVYAACLVAPKCIAIVPLNRLWRCLVIIKFPLSLPSCVYGMQ